MTPTFIHSHIVDYVILFHLRALQPPNWLAPWHCGVRVDSSNKLVGFIAAVPADVLIYETWVAHKYMQRCGFMWNLMSNISIHITFQQDCSNFPANAGRSGWCRSNSCVFIRSCASSGWLQSWSESLPDESTSRASTRLSTRLLSCCPHHWAPAGSSYTGRIHTWLKGKAKPQLLSAQKIIFSHCAY